MGIVAKFQCAKCGEVFEAAAGGGFAFLLYRCVNCDVVKQVECEWRGGVVIPPDAPPSPPPTEEQIGVCENCRGELRDDLAPMCPRCKGRNTEEKEVLIDYD